MTILRTSAELKNCKLENPSLLFVPLHVAQYLGSDKRWVLSPCITFVSKYLLKIYQLNIPSSSDYSAELYAPFSFHHHLHPLLLNHKHFICTLLLLLMDFFYHL